MNKKIEFPFANARRITPEEVNKAKIAIKQQFGQEYTVRQNENDYEIISFKINPKILDWAKQEAEKEVLITKYLSIINCLSYVLKV